MKLDVGIGTRASSDLIRCAPPPVDSAVLSQRTVQIASSGSLPGTGLHAWFFQVTSPPSSPTPMMASKRLLSAHVPYIDGNVYLDGGGDASNNYDRINQSVGTPDDKSVWNHWAFVRNSGAGRMAIYKNGVLFHEQATGLTRSMTGCTRMAIGAAGDGKWPHAGPSVSYACGM